MRTRQCYNCDQIVRGVMLSEQEVETLKKSGIEYNGRVNYCCRNNLKKIADVIYCDLANEGRGGVNVRNADTNQRM